MSEGPKRHFYWYWPFARSEELLWASATLRDGEQITVQVIDREASPRQSGDSAVHLVRDLPDVDRDVSRSLRWARSRAATYRSRERLRRNLWSSGAFDLVHLHYVNRFTDAWSALPRPLVMSVHDVVPHVPRIGARGEHELLSRLYRRPEAIIVHHAHLAERLHYEFRVPEGRIHVVPHQVFPVGEPIRDPPTGTPTVLFFGAFRPNKGIEVLDSMMQGIGADIRLVVAGRGDRDLEDRVRGMANRDPRVRAEIGFASLDRKRELFRNAHVVVLPYTDFASQSGVLQDAYGHGRPVVVTDVGALGQSVREEGTGLSVQANDPRALADAVASLLEPATWRAHADAAVRMATERSPETTGTRLRRVYDLVLP